MKKLLTICILFTTLNFMVAQEGSAPGTGRMPTEQSQVPTAVTEKFNREYPGISGSWSVDGDNFRVEFVDPQSHLGHIIVYDRNGDVIRRESELDRTSNPGAINEFYNKNYPGEQLKTWSVTERDGTLSYYTNRNSQMVKFDRDGRPTEQQTEVKSGPVKKKMSQK